MDDKYKRLIYEMELYTEDFITNFGVADKHWNSETNMKKESFLRHQMCCVLMCNMERKEFTDILIDLQKTKSEKRKKRDYSDLQTNTKRLKLDENTLLETSSDIPSTSKSKSSDDTMDILEEINNYPTMLEDEADDDMNEDTFRFQLLEGMPNIANLQAKYAKLWGCAIPNKKWDLVDTLLKKFVEIKVTQVPWKRELEYKEYKYGMGEHTALALIHPQTGDVQWTDHAGCVKGEMKIKKFIIDRSLYMALLGIYETSQIDDVDYEVDVFCSSWFNDMVDKWEKDFSKDMDNEKLEEKYSKPPISTKSVDPNYLYTNLSKLNEDFRTGTMRWRGKIIPEGWTKNIEANCNTDSEMVSVFINEMLKEEVEDIFFHNYKEDERPDPRIFNDIVGLWMSGKENTFDVTEDFSDDASRKNIRKILGIGEKGLIHDPDDITTKQIEYRKLEHCRYGHWFSEVIRRMNIRRKNDYIPMAQLLRKENDPIHPIARISESLGEEFFAAALQTNAALYMSKMVNFYSRLGGAYLVWLDRRKKTSHDAIAIFPVYSTVRKIDDIEDKKRLISGICLRGPHHARSPTDKINILTVEILERTDDSNQIIGALNKAIVYRTKNNYFVFRQNAIMKDDSTYMAFPSNSLFIPMNLLGMMTLNNPANVRTEDFYFLSQKMMEHGLDWLIERYVEGIIMCSIGNSRDEGYFAQLRKLFMILLAFRRKKPVGSWDMKEFVEKTNECLIDNPLSFHFHITIIEILRIYSSVIESWQRPIVMD